MASAVVFAYHDVGVRCLSVLLAQGIEVRLVVTHDDNPAETIWFASVEQLALQHGLAVIKPKDANAPEVVQQVRALAPDFLFSFYYRSMLGPELLSVPRIAALNMHGSLLPKYRGRVPVNWAIIHGETETGATLHYMLAKPDAGAIVDRERVSIGPDEQAVEVFRKVTGAAERCLARAVPKLVAGTAAAEPQDLKAGSYYGGRTAADGVIDWRQGAQRIHDLVRAVAPPYPGATTTVAGQSLRVLRTRRAFDERSPYAQPTLFLRDDQLHVVAGDGRLLQLLELDGGGAPFDLDAFKDRLRAGAVPLT
jgi:methionyl-tRNA formyltransferase